MEEKSKNKKQSPPTKETEQGLLVAKERALLGSQFSVMGQQAHQLLDSDWHLSIEQRPQFIPSTSV